MSWGQEEEEEEEEEGREWGVREVGVGRSPRKY